MPALSSFFTTRGAVTPLPRIGSMATSVDTAMVTRPSHHFRLASTTMLSIVGGLPREHGSPIPTVSIYLEHPCTVPLPGIDG